MRNLFFYYEQFGEPCAAKTVVDDGVFLGGAPDNILTQFVVSENEYALSLDQLKRLYPYVQN